MLTCRPNVGPVRSIHALPRMDARLAGFLLFGFRFGENYGAIRHPRCWKTGPGKTAERSIYLLFESRHEQKSRVLRGWSWTWTALTGNRLSASTGDLSSKRYPLSPDVRDDNTRFRCVVTPEATSVAAATPTPTPASQSNEQLAKSHLSQGRDKLQRNGQLPLTVCSPMELRE